MKRILPIALLCSVLAPALVAGVADPSPSTPESQPSGANPGAISAPLSTPLDWSRSPYTGFTRQHWLEITERLLAGVLPYFDPATGIPKLPHAPGEEAFNRGVAPPGSIGVDRQAFERIMMLAVIYSGATGRDRVPGYDGSITEPFRRGMISTLDPKSPHYWGPPAGGEHAGSIFVFGALMSPRFFWEPFTAGQREFILDYLEQLAAARSYDNNHYFFHMMALPLLEANGRSTDRDLHTSRLERLLGWYRGDGWYIDGSNLSFDKYNAWGFQLYNQAVYRFDSRWRKQFGERIATISQEYLRDYPYRIGRDGGPVPWGRSLSYRFAELSAIGWASLNGLNPLPPGQSRRIASGVLRYFWEHGAQDKDGMLHVGFRDTNATVAEFYNGPGTSYWAAQGLIALMIPENDPFWTSVEEPMPADGGATTRVAMQGPSIVTRVRADGEARLYPVRQPFSRAHQHWQRGVKYQQHAYSSELGWCALGEGTDLGAGRTGISLNGTDWTFRDHARVLSIDDSHVSSAWGFDVNLTYQPAIDDRYELVTHTLIGQHGELHVFWHQSPQPVYLHLAGYGIASPSVEAVNSEQSDGGRRIDVRTPGYATVLRILDAPRGKLTNEVLEPREGWRFAHLFDRIGSYPVWRSDEPVPANVPVIAYVDGARAGKLREPEIELQRVPGALIVILDGEHHVVDLPW